MCIRDRLNEDNAKNGDLFTTADRPYGNDVDDGTDTCGHVADLLAPVLLLILACIFGMKMCIRDRHHVSGLNGSVRAKSAHCNAHIGTGQHRGIVDAVAHNGKVLFGPLCGEQRFDLVYLVARQQARMVFIPVSYTHLRQAPPLQPIPLHPAVQQATAACSRT